MTIGDPVWIDKDGQEQVGQTGLTLEEWLNKEVGK